MNYYCPRCGGELDTGMTCSACAQHWQARSAPDPDSGPKVTMDQVHVFLDNGIPFGISPHYLSDWLRSIVAGVEEERERWGQLQLDVVDLRTQLAAEQARVRRLREVLSKQTWTPEIGAALAETGPVK